MQAKHGSSAIYPAFNPRIFQPLLRRDAEYRRRSFSSDPSLRYKDSLVNPHHMPQSQFCTTRKRQRSEQHLTLNKTVTPLQKQKFARSIEPTSNKSFWDNLSKIWLTKSALKELDRRNDQAIRALSHQQTRRPVTRNFQKSRPTFPNATDYTRSCKPKAVKNIKQFARHGGPDLRDIRSYPEPIKTLHHTMSSEQFNKRGKKKSSASTATTKPTTGTSNTKPTTTISAYSKNFSQHLIDYNIYPNYYEYPDGSVAAEPEGWEEINNRLKRPRPSLSPSQFSDGAFRRFTRADEYAANETEVRERALPIVEGNIPYGGCRAVEVAFTNLVSLTDESLPDKPKPAKPDIYYGARPEQLDQRVRQELNDFIVPAEGAPVAPNFLVEAKGPNGTRAVVNRQARYDGALGARGMHRLHSYGQEEPVYDNCARAITSTYSDGQLKMFAHHVTEPASKGGRPEYHMTQINTWGMTGNATTFRQGATAYRNARDWAKEQRDQAIEQANRIAADKNALDLAKRQEEGPIQQVSQAEASGRTGKSIAQTTNESFVSTSSFRTEVSESEPYTLSQTSDVYDSQTTSDLHASHTLTKTRLKEKQSKKRQSTQPAQTRRKRGEKDVHRGD